MRYTLYSYRHAEEIIHDSKFNSAFDEIVDSITRLLVFWYPNKSSSDARLDVSQQLSNIFFDRILGVEKRWKWHPLATRIEKSKLAADFQKTFGAAPDSLTIQTEVQYGNMARWYSDVFKFQAAYSQNLIQMGVSIVPCRSLGVRVDSNVAYLERVKRELPSATLSITLPILVFGLEPGDATPVYDLRRTLFVRDAADSRAAKRALGKVENGYRVVNAYLRGDPPDIVGPASPIGPRPTPVSAVDPDNPDSGKDGGESDESEKL